MTFATALLPDDLSLMSRPVTYLFLAARALDARPHDVVAYVDMTGEWAVNPPHERVFRTLHRAGELRVGAFRSEHQHVLAQSGDHRRIEWGTAFLAVAAGAGDMVMDGIDHCRDAFARTGRLSGDCLRASQPCKVDYISDPVASATLRLPTDGAVRHVLIAYDDGWLIEAAHPRGPLDRAPRLARGR